MSIINFEVESHNIKAGVQGDCTLCPVGLQLKQRYPNAEIEVHSDYVMIDRVRWEDHDGSLSEFIIAFDQDTDELDEDEVAEHNEILESWYAHGYPIQLRQVINEFNN